MLFKDYLAKLPTSVLKKMSFYPRKIVLPTKIEPIEFYDHFSAQIKSPVLTNEKAIYVAAIVEKSDYMSASDMMLKNVTL